jgi:glycosyltransferase
MLDISVVIPSFNDERILQTFASIDSQDYDRERVTVHVVDGGSNEELRDRMAAALSPGDVLTVESDEGIFDAINKGVRRAGGDLVFTVGSDDLFASRDALATFSDHIERTDADYAVCGTIYTLQDLTPFRHWPATLPTKGNFLKGRQCCHFAFACRPSVYAELGGFDLAYPTASDFDFFIRLAKNDSLHGVPIDDYLVAMRQGGNSSKNLRNVVKGNAEIREIMVKHFGPFSQAVLPLKFYWKTTEMARTRWFAGRVSTPLWFTDSS